MPAKQTHPAGGWLMGPVAVLHPSEAAPECAARVLLLERDAATTERIQRQLCDPEFSAQLTVAKSAAELENQLRSNLCDVVLLDPGLDERERREACQLLKSSWPETPLILLEGCADQHAVAECAKLGASEYVLKNDPGWLAFALKRVLTERITVQENARLRVALNESEKRAQDLMENAIYGIFQAEADGVFLAANETLQKILACSSFEEIHALNLAKDVFRYPEAFAHLLTESQERGMVRNAEAEWRRRDGGFVCVRLHLRPAPQREAKDAIEGFVEDVTEMRALERQLQQAQKFETIGQLAGGIAHDFNNVLGAVLGWAEIGYDQSREHPQLAEYFAHIRQQADRAAALTRELLTFARRQTLQPRPVQLNEVIESLMSLFDKVIGKDVEIKAELGSLLPVKADPAQLEQVLMNICLNARDAMPDGGRLRIRRR